MADSSWNVMAHGDTREGKWRVNWWMEWVTSTLHTTSEHGVSSITTAGAHTSAASIRLNWRPRRFKLTLPFRRKTKSGYCACAITFQLASTYNTNQWHLLEMNCLLPVAPTHVSCYQTFLATHPATFFLIDLESVAIQESTTTLHILCWGHFFSVTMSLCSVLVLMRLLRPLAVRFVVFGKDFLFSFRVSSRF